MRRDTAVENEWPFCHRGFQEAAHRAGTSNRYERKRGVRQKRESRGLSNPVFVIIPRGTFDSTLNFLLLESGLIGNIDEAFDAVLDAVDCDG